MIVLTESEAQNSPLERVGRLSSREDVATVLQTWEAALREEPEAWKSFGWMGEMRGRYFFVKGSGGEKAESLWEWLRSVGAGEVLGAEANCLNVRALSGKGRGVPTGRPWERGNDGSEAGSHEETGYLGESEPTGYLGEAGNPRGYEPKLRRIKGEAVMSVVTSPSVIGRSLSGCRMVVPDNPMVSRKHARIWMEGERVFLEDLGSSNGTFVDGVRLMSGERKELRRGSLVLLSDEEFILE